MGIKSIYAHDLSQKIIFEIHLQIHLNISPNAESFMKLQLYRGLKNDVHSAKTIKKQVLIIDIELNAIQFSTHC